MRRRCANDLHTSFDAVDTCMTVHGGGIKHAAPHRLNEPPCLRQM